MAFIKHPVLTYRRVKTWGLKSLIALTILQLPSLLTVVQWGYWASLDQCKFTLISWILSNHTVFTHRTEVSGLYFKDISNYTNITTSLSNTHSWRWGDCVSSTHFGEKKLIIMSILYFSLKQTYPLYSSPLINIQASKGSIITMKLHWVSVCLGVPKLSALRVWDHTQQKHIGTINWEGAAAANKFVWLKQFFKWYQRAPTAPELLNEFSSSESQELTQDCSVAPWHRLSFDHQLDLHCGLLGRVEDGHAYGFLHPRAKNRRCCNQITPEEHNWEWSVRTEPRECYFHLWDTFCAQKGKSKCSVMYLPCRVTFAITSSSKPVSNKYKWTEPKCLQMALKSLGFKKPSNLSMFIASIIKNTFICLLYVTN